MISRRKLDKAKREESFGREVIFFISVVIEAVFSIVKIQYLLKQTIFASSNARF